MSSVKHEYVPLRTDTANTCGLLGLTRIYRCVILTPTLILMRCTSRYFVQLKLEHIVFERLFIRDHPNTITAMFHRSTRTRADVNGPQTSAVPGILFCLSEAQAHGVRRVVYLLPPKHHHSHISLVKREHAPLCNGPQTG